VASLFGQNNSGIKLIGHWGESNGDCEAVEVKGDTAYFTEGRGFKILDYTDKGNPILISQFILPNNNITTIKIKNNFAYLLSSSYLMVIDISDISNPFLLNQYEVHSGRNIIVKDNLLYIVYGYYDRFDNDIRHGGFLVLDVSNTNSITERYNYQTNYLIYDIAIKDTTAYIAAQDSLLVFNIAGTGLPKKVAQLEYETYGSSLCIADNYIYTVDIFLGISVYNIDDPYTLNLIGNLDVPGYNIKYYNNYLFMTQYYKNNGPDDLKIVILDATSPVMPIKISELNMGDFGFADCLAYSNNYLYVSHGSSGLYVVDVSDVSNPIEKTRYKTGYKYDVAINNNYAYLSSDYDGVQIIDITNKANPHLIGKIDLKEHPVDRTKKVVIEDNILYLMIDRYKADFVNSIYMVDISTPANPKILGHFDTNLMMDFEVKNRIIYLTGIYYFGIVDATDPANPVFLKTFSKGSGAGDDLTLSGNYAFIGEWSNGLRIIDISDSMNLYEAGSFNDFCVGDISVNQNLVYIIAQSHVESEFSLRVLNISNITSINKLGAIKLSSNTKGIAFKNEKVIVGDGLKIIDVSNPENPKVIDSSDVCGDVNEIILDDKYIYVADGTDGLYIFQYDGLVSSVEHDNFIQYSFNLHQNYPNPFNPNTTISYTIPESGLVQLRIYNVLGQQVASLINKEQSKGNYKVEFNASSLASGIYFYRLQNRSHSETKKLIFSK
jgi:hypothetical protein